MWEFVFRLEALAPLVVGKALKVLEVLRKRLGSQLASRAEPGQELNSLLIGEVVVAVEGADAFRVETAEPRLLGQRTATRATRPREHTAETLLQLWRLLLLATVTPAFGFVALANLLGTLVGTPGALGPRRVGGLFDQLVPVRSHCSITSQVASLRNGSFGGFEETYCFQSLVRKNQLRDMTSGKAAEYDCL